MPSQMTTLVILAISAALALGGCGDKNPQATFNPDTGAHPAGWKADHKTFARSNIDSCVPCHGENFNGGISKVSCTQCHIGSQSAAHPLQWGSYAYARHAAYVVTNGTSTCANAACHGTTLAGTGSIPSCTACHSKNGDTYSKHPATWQTALKDHSAYLKTKTSSAKAVSAEVVGSSLYQSCGTSKCHGTDLKGVFLSGTSCYLCHSQTTQTGAISKHPVSWSSALSSHGSYVVANSNASCGTSVCHGLDYNGVLNSGPSCYKCHISGPSSKHPVDWGGYSTHGKYVIVNSYGGCATALCHGTDAKGGSSGAPSCFSCHSSGPSSKHPVEWAGYAKQGVPSHGLYVKAKGTVSCATSLCHGMDGKGISGGDAPSCYSCHASGPTSEHPLTWHTSPLADHFAYVKTNGYASCATSVCHGTAATGVLGSGTSCFSCHAAGPTSKHPTTWNTSALVDHSGYVKANGAKGNDYTSCATVYCHGIDAQGGTGGSTAPSCYSCHLAGPTAKHPQSWGAAPNYYDHISYKNSHTTYKCSTTLCHPTGHFVISIDNTACRKCHAN